MAKEKNFLEKLQSADEGTKNRWMIGATVIVMALVVYVWFGYFNGMISGGIADESASSVPAQAVPPADGFTFLETVRGGVGLVYTFFDDQLHGLRNILQAPRDIDIQPPQQ